MNEIIEALNAAQIAFNDLIESAPGPEQRAAINDVHRCLDDALMEATRGDG